MGGQLAFEVQGPDGGVGSHTPFVQVNPAAQVPPPLQSARHRLSAHTSLCAHWLVYSQVDADGSQAPATQISPPMQSVVSAQGQGPDVPPQASPESSPPVSESLSVPASTAIEQLSPPVAVQGEGGSRQS